MPRAALAKLIAQTHQHHYAVGYFESWNLESLQGMLDEAERSQSLIIIGFVGHFLSRSERSTDAQEIERKIKHPSTHKLQALTPHLSSSTLR